MDTTTSNRKNIWKIHESSQFFLFLDFWFSLLCKGTYIYTTKNGKDTKSGSENKPNKEIMTLYFVFFLSKDSKPSRVQLSKEYDTIHEFHQI